jgi:DNA-binding response OmpR family regulator
VLIDLDLGDMDGYQVWEALRELAAREGRTFRVIIMSGVVTNRDRTLALQRGAAAALQKATNPDYFGQVVRRLLSEGNSGDEERTHPAA